MSDDYSAATVGAVDRAVAERSDFGGWLANVLATVAARHPEGADGLTAGRPGGWEAQHVASLAAGGVELRTDDLDPSHDLRIVLAAAEGWAGDGTPGPSPREDGSLEPSDVHEAVARLRQTLGREGPS